MTEVERQSKLHLLINVSDKQNGQITTKKLSSSWIKDMFDLITETSTLKTCNNSESTLSALSYFAKIICIWQ